MSIKCQTRVWDHSAQKGNALIVLLAIAEQAGDDGSGAYPSIERLAGMARVSKRQIKRILIDLEKSGELAIERGMGRGNFSRYTVNVGLAERVTSEVKGDTQTSPLNGAERVTFPMERVTFEDGKGDIFDGKGDTAAAPDPLRSIRDPLIREEEESARESWQPQMEDPPQPPPTPTQHGRVTSSNIDPRKIGQDGLIPPGHGDTPFEVYREFFAITPTAYQIKTMMREVSDLGLWREILQKWCLAGHRSNSFDNLLDIYHNGWRTNGNGQSRPYTQQNDSAGTYRASSPSTISDVEYDRIRQRQVETLQAKLAAAGRTDMSNLLGKTLRVHN